MKAKATEYVVFDVETTGLTPLNGDRMVEIAAIKIKDMKIVDTFESLINPQRTLSTEAMQINNITEDMIKDAPTADEVLPKMISFVSGACLVGHNVAFDLKFLCYELSLMGRRLQSTTPAVDTLKMARGLLPHLGSHRLSNVAIYLGVPISTTHRALADVELTIKVMEHLLNLAEDQRIVTFQDVYDKYSVIKPEFKIQQINQEFLF